MWFIAARKTDLNCKNNFNFIKIKYHILYYEPVECYTTLRIYCLAHLLYADRQKIFLLYSHFIPCNKVDTTNKSIVIVNKA